jgi:DNA-directed RNA polymerase specialized sigma24 family protein
MTEMSQTDRTALFEQFIDLYYPSIFSAIRKLAGVSDEKELEILTVKVFVELWQNSEDLFSKVRPPAYIYKILLKHVLDYLKKKGAEEHIQQLQNTLLIDPSFYESILQTGPSPDSPQP